MTLVAIVGNLGSGKTLTQTYLLFKKFIEGKAVYANYLLKFPYTPISDVEGIDSMHSGVFGGDELWSWLDSRASKEARNRIIASILLKSRKRDMHIYYTTQSFMQMDKRVRNITDFVVLPSLNKNSTICTALWYNRHEIGTGHDIPMNKTKFYTNPIFKLYDTKEEVNPLD